MGELATFWYSLVLMSKFFHAFEGHPKLGVITETLRRGIVDITHFMIVFMLVFINFTLGAYFIYGNQLYEWSNFWLALNSSFRTLMGDFDFAAMYAISPVPAMVWFWLYMVLFYLIMLNMLLAIVMDTYSEVKSECDHKCEEMEGLKREASEAASKDMPEDPPPELEFPFDPPPPVLPGQVQQRVEPPQLEKLYAIAASCELMMHEVNDRLGRLEHSADSTAQMLVSKNTVHLLRSSGTGWRDNLTCSGDV